MSTVLGVSIFNVIECLLKFTVDYVAIAPLCRCRSTGLSPRLLGCPPHRGPLPVLSPWSCPLRSLVGVAMSSPSGRVRVAYARGG